MYFGWAMSEMSKIRIPRSRLARSEEHTSELQSRLHLVCRLLLEKKKNIWNNALASDRQRRAPEPRQPRHELGAHDSLFKERPHDQVYERQRHRAGHEAGTGSPRC